MTIGKQLEVTWWDGSAVGLLAHRGTIYFAYDEAWIARGHNLSPISLPFGASAFNGAKGVDGLPGLIADCLPDAWGRKVAGREFLRNGWGEPATMSLLAWRGARGLGAFRFKPTLDGKTSDKTLHAVSAAMLARGAAAIERGAPADVLPALARGGTAGGAFPKALVLAHDDGTLSVGDPDGKAVPCMVKFDLSPKGEQVRCEHAFTRMATAAGIHAVDTTLLPEGPRSKRAHLLVNRFDVPDQTQPQRRTHFHSLSGVLHRSPSSLDYTDLFRAALLLGVQPSDIREIARRMIFNVLAGNADDHGKNHGFLYDEGSRKWAISPAYDLTYSPMMLERGMAIRGDVWPTSATLYALCSAAEVSDAEFAMVLDQVLDVVDKWPLFAREAEISKETQIEISERQTKIREAVIG